MRTIGVIGCGVVGEAVAKSFETRKFRVKRYDRYKKDMNDYRAILDTDAVFICVPTATDFETGKQDLEPLNEVLAILKAEKYTGVICVKSTVLPGTCDRLSKNFKMPIVHNPEFLTAANPYQDFMDQTVVLIGGLDIEATMEIGEIYYQARFAPIRIFASATITEAAKYMRNNYLATKVSFFNEQRELCELLGAKYEQVLEAMLSVGGVERGHTKSPGPDGQVGFGGMCFPKDTLAQYRHGKDLGLEMESLKGTIDGNNRRRKGA